MRPRTPTFPWPGHLNTGDLRSHVGVTLSKGLANTAQDYTTTPFSTSITSPPSPLSLQPTPAAINWIKTNCSHTQQSLLCRALLVSVAACVSSQTIPAQSISLSQPVAAVKGWCTPVGWRGRPCTLAGRALCADRCWCCLLLLLGLCWLLHHGLARHEQLLKILAEPSGTAAANMQTQ